MKLPDLPPAVLATAHWSGTPFLVPSVVGFSSAEVVAPPPGVRVGGFFAARLSGRTRRDPADMAPRSPGRSWAGTRGAARLLPPPRQGTQFPHAYRVSPRLASKATTPPRPSRGSAPPYPASRATSGRQPQPTPYTSPRAATGNWQAPRTPWPAPPPQSSWQSRPGPGWARPTRPLPPPPPSWQSRAAPRWARPPRPAPPPPPRAASRPSRGRPPGG
jgi:hypothetical protein